MDSEANRTIEMPALGRPFSLGMLYDCRNDKFIPGMTLWDHDDLVKHVGERPQNYNGVKIDASESIQEKCSALNVEGSVKLSLFFGLISVEGSAKYLHDDKTYKNQARVTLEYEAYTKFQELSMDHLGKCNVKHPDIFEKGLATHVVTGILYGAKAFFVFDRDVSNDESHQQCEGFLKLIKIPFLSGKASLKTEDKDKQRADKFSCNFHGDFLLDKTPVSFEDAIQVYQSLPKLLGANGENAIPMKVWLMPLTSLDPSAAKLVHEISPVFIEEIEAFLEDLREVQMRCNDALRTAAQQGPVSGKKIKTFKDMCSKFKKAFQQNLAKKLPVIRRGEEEEDAVLAEIREKRRSSPFNIKNLKEWMDCIEREISILNSLTSNMKNTKIVSSQTDLYKEILSVDHAVCYVFPSLGSDEYLSTLSNYLKQTTKPDNPEESRIHDVEQEQWYASKEATDTMRRKAKLFSDFAEANKENKNIKFLAVGSTGETQKGSSIVLYKDGFSFTENFEPPSKPETVTVRDKNHNSVTLKISPAKFGAENITSYSVEYCVSGQDGWKEKTSQAEEVTVSDLSPNTEYKFRCRAVTSVGVGPANEVSGSIKTSPCSPPGKPQVGPNSSEISVSWKKSQEKSKRVLEDFSELEMRCNDALKTTTAQQFPQIGTKIKTFKEMCSEFKLDFQQSLAKKLPSIRGGEEEAVLAEILKKIHSSPFNSKDLNKWMDCKEREIHTLKSLTNMMENNKIVSSETDRYKESLSADYAVCFVFTSLGSDEPYLSTLSEYLEETTKPDEARGSRTHDVEKEQWYASREVADTMWRKAKLFSDFAEANKENKNIKFLAVGSTDETQKGSSIYLYKDGFSEPEDFEPPSKPETVTVRNINHNSVTLKISPAKFGAENITSYFVEYCVSGQDGWKEKTAPEAEEVTVSDLSPNTEYKFRCRAVTSVGVGPANEVSGSIKTSPGKPQVKRLADVVKGNSRLLENQPGPLPVYKVPLEEERMSVAGGRCFSFGNPIRNRTIMVLGATGAGKSTLINGMINYILGVEWEDPYRFKLVDEDPSKSEAESQTSEVTVYKINHQQGFKIDHSLTIVDTPGFGDTRGIERDKEITDQLRNLFTDQRGVSEVDAVCFVAQSALARLTPTQKYVFDSVLSIFGKDVAENIRVLVTFADGQRPPVLEAIKASDVPCPKTQDGQPVHFKFNNSAFFADKKSFEAGSMMEEDESDIEENFDQMFWKMGTKSMKKFFVALNKMETKSLTMTKEVLRERLRLENSVENLQVKVKLGLAKLEEIKETSEKLKEHEAEISRYENYEFYVTVKKPVQIDISHSGYYITNCQQCHYICHYPCDISNDADKRRCAAMGPNGYCTECPGKCIWSVHYNQKYSWGYEEVQEKRTSKELQEKYEQASKDKTSVEAMIATLRAEYDRVQDEVENLMESSAQCLDRLKEIALKSNPLSTPQYIDLLIEEEKSEDKRGWQQRVQSLITIREQAETLAKVGRGEKLLCL